MLMEGHSIFHSSRPSTPFFHTTSHGSCPSPGVAATVASVAHLRGCVGGGGGAEQHSIAAVFAWQRIARRLHSCWSRKPCRIGAANTAAAMVPPLLPTPHPQHATSSSTGSVPALLMTAGPPAGHHVCAGVCLAVGCSHVR